MHITSLDTPEDMQWLLSVHGIPASFAVVYGNEDAPEYVDAYDCTSPTITDMPLRWSQDENGVLRTDGVKRPR